MPSYLPKNLNDSKRAKFNHERHHKSVINTQYMSSVYPLMAKHSNLMAYLEANPVVASQIWYNQSAIKRLKDSPGLIDKLDKDPGVEVPKFVKETPSSAASSAAPSSSSKAPRSSSTSSFCIII